MKINFFTAVFLIATTFLHAQVDFRNIQSKGDMDQAWADAALENKLLFVDIYATWCGPCKWMDANVFAMQEAGEFMNQSFINVKMDGESEFGRQFAMGAGLTAYPSFFIYNSEQEMMNKMMGAKPWEEFKPMLSSTVEYYPVLTLLQRKFESNILEKSEYAMLTKACREMGKEKYGNVVAETYKEKFMTGGDLTEEDIRVMAFYTEIGSSTWEKMLSDIPGIKSALDKELPGFIDASITETIEKSVEEGSVQYVSDFAEVLPELTEGIDMQADQLVSRAYIYYYHYSEMYDELINYIDSEYAKNQKDDHRWLFEAASNAVFLNPRISVLAEKGVDWFSKCVDLKETQDYYYYLGLSQYYTQQPEAMIASMKKAKELSVDQDFIRNVDSIIEQVEEEISN